MHSFSNEIRKSSWPDGLVIRGDPRIKGIDFNTSGGGAFDALYSRCKPDPGSQISINADILPQVKAKFVLARELNEFLMVEKPLTHA